MCQVPMCTSNLKATPFRLATHVPSLDVYSSQLYHFRLATHVVNPDVYF